MNYYCYHLAPAYRAAVTVARRWCSSALVHPPPEPCMPVNEAAAVTLIMMVPAIALGGALGFGVGRAVYRGE